LKKNIIITGAFTPDEQQQPRPCFITCFFVSGLSTAKSEMLIKYFGNIF
jgi:hypothetical protein